MAKLFRESMYKEFIASRSSFSYFFCFLLTVCVVLLPFFLAFTTNQFWTKQNFYTEQPIVNFRSEFIVLGYSSTDGTFAFTSMAEVADMMVDQNKPGVAKVSWQDFNED